MMKFSILTLVLTSAFLFLSLPSFAQTQVNVGITQDITIDGVCKRIRNNCAGNIMVPTFDSTQFNAIPSSFGLAGCATASACTTITATSGNITLNAYNGCFVKADRSGYCTGMNNYYNGGTGNTTNTTTLTSISGSYTWAQVAGTNEGACGLTTTGDLMCWGANIARAQNSSSGWSTVPTVVYGGGQWSLLAKSGGTPNYMCAIRDNLDAYCWGKNLLGQVGDGTTTDRYVPTLVLGGYSWSKIAVGNSFLWNSSATDPVTTTCGIRTDGAMMCWGGNGAGQLADGTTTNRSSPVLIPGGYTWKDVATGNNIVCGIRTDGAAMCWGDNSDGQLGDGTTVAKTTPTLVSGGYNWASITTGYKTTCGIRTDGTGMCWGSNSNGQMGTTVGPWVYTSSTPLAISGGLLWTEILTSAYASTCGIATDNKLYCWGFCSDNQCTSAVPNNSNAPVLVGSGF